MTSVLLVIHLFVTLALIGVVLIQRSEGGGLGIGTSQGMGAFMSGRGTANLLTRTTAILATLFFGLSLALALLNRGTGGVGRSLLDLPPTPAATAPATPPASAPAPAPAPGPAITPRAMTPAVGSPDAKSSGGAATGPTNASPSAAAPSRSLPAAPAAKQGPSVPTN